MPFLAHNDALLTEETAASDYLKWLGEDAFAEEDFSFTTSTERTATMDSSSVASNSRQLEPHG